MRMFRSRNEWFDHELQTHRKQWTCQFCEEVPFGDKNSFIKHTKMTHKDNLATSTIEALLVQSEEPVERIMLDACQLCDDWKAECARKHNILREKLQLQAAPGLYGTVRQFRHHLARHMEDLALFALPPSVPDEESDDDSQSSERTSSLIADPVLESALEKPHAQDLGRKSAELAFEESPSKQVETHVPCLDIVNTPKPAKPTVKSTVTPSP